MKNPEVYDLETLSNLFTYTGYNCTTKKWHQFVICSWQNDLKELVKHLSKNDIYHVGYNNLSFDYPVLHTLLSSYREWEYLSGSEVATKLYDRAQELISSDEYHVISDAKTIIPQVDLFKIFHFDNAARRTSLKDLEVAMNLDSVQEMPISHTKWCVPGDEKVVLEYNKNDVLATYEFFKIALGRTDLPLYKGEDRILLRTQLQQQFHISCINWPDVKIGEQLILKMYCDKTHTTMKYLKQLGGTKREKIIFSECIPDWVKFETPTMQKVLERFKKTISTGKKGEFSFSIIFHGIQVDYGSGGVHACCNPGVYESNEEYIIKDQDVGSLYPSMAISLGLYPAHLGKEFTNIYDQDIVSVRLAEKVKPKKERNMVIMKGFKLAANGIYGKTGEETSLLYDPLYKFKTTIAGQLYLSMWAEKLVAKVPEVKFLQWNTDGITYKVPREKLPLTEEVTKEMCDLTGFIIEDAYYKKMILRDVNNYIAVYQNDDFKLKGCFEIDKELHKDPSMKIVPIALKEYYVNNVPIEKTIKEHKNIYDFCLRLKINSTSEGTFTTWNKDKTGLEKVSLGRTTRYYVSTRNDAGTLEKKFDSGSISGVVVGNTVTLFNKYFEEENFDDYKIDYSFYIKETNKIKNAVNDGQQLLFD